MFFSRISLYFFKLKFIAIYGLDLFKVSFIYGQFSIIQPGNFKFGKGLAINDYAYINAMGGITVGDNFIISAGAKIITAKLRAEQGAFSYKKEHIYAGNNIQVGAGAVILPGVTICDNVIIGANAVVSRSIVEPGVYVGMPASKI